LIHHKRWRSAALVAAVATLGLAACTSARTAAGGDNANLYTKYGAMSASERDPQLATLAAKEGPVNIYTSFQDMDKLANAFEKAYPGVKAKVYRADAETAYAKAEQENQANKTAADVMETDSLLMDQLVTQGLVTDKYKVDPSNLIDGAVHQGWTAARFKAFFVSWNTNTVKGSDVPHTYQDLENPKWKGKIALEVGDYGWYRGLFDYFVSTGMKPADVTAMWQKIAANARVVKGHTQTAALLQSGEYSIFADSYDDGILALQEKKAPVSYKDDTGNVAVQPVFINNTGIGAMAKGPDPAGAMLFVDYFLSPPGQKLVNDLGNIPAYVGINHELDGVKTVSGNDAELASKSAQDGYIDLLKNAAKG
jgi:iron(III) transport system substrate-binding protein